jgi:hypothetical protein
LVAAAQRGVKRKEWFGKISRIIIQTVVARQMLQHTHDARRYHRFRKLFSIHFAVVGIVAVEERQVWPRAGGQRRKSILKTTLPRTHIFSRPKILFCHLF